MSLEELPLSLLIDYDNEHIGEVSTRDYVEKATDLFTEFYAEKGIDRLKRSRFRQNMKKIVVKQIGYIIKGKDMYQGLDAIGVWMSKDILFPQILEAHLQPKKNLDLVNLYLHIHRMEEVK